MSCSVKVKSVMLFSVLPIAKNSGGLGTDYSALGFTNTLALLFAEMLCSKVRVWVG